MSETRPHKRSVIHPRGSILPAFHVRFAANEFKFDSKHNPLPSFSLCSTADEIDSSLGEGDSVYRGAGAKVWLPNMGERGWKKSGPFDAKWILEKASGRPAQTRSFFQLLSRATPPPLSFPRFSLPFDFDAFPLCYRLSLCACRPWRGKRLLSLSPSLPLPLSNSSRSTINHHHRDITKVKGSASEISRNLCVRVTCFEWRPFCQDLWPSLCFSLSLSLFMEARSKDLIKISPVKRRTYISSCTLFQPIFFSRPSYEPTFSFYLTNVKGRKGWNIIGYR